MKIIVYCRKRQFLLINAFSFFWYFDEKNNEYIKIIIEKEIALLNDNFY